MSKSTKAARRSSTEWASLMEACARNGLSRTAFAEREGIHPRTFTWWASRLGSDAKRAACERGGAKASVANEAKFVPVHVRVDGPQGARITTEPARRSPARTSTSGGVEIVLSNGRRVRCDLEHAADPRLASLLALAEGVRQC